MRIHWIWLAHRPGVSDRMKASLLEHFQDAEDIFFADGEALAQCEDLTEEAVEGLLDKDLTGAEAIQDTCDRLKVQILTYQDAAYPTKLKQIPDPPMVLYYKGRLPELDALPVIGVVGTRKASAYGMTTAKRMGYQIGKCGGIVVSGMAFGIDAMATAGALSAGQKAIGVLGCGVDIVYPQSNRELFRDMEQYGCILSEFSPGMPPIKWNFPKRNRIISGLSDGVLVVEAPEKSGALITAHLAAEQGRDVFAVPGNIDMPSFVGSNRLLRDGATMVSTGWEVVSEYEGRYPGKIRKADHGILRSACTEEPTSGAKEGEKTAPKVAQKPKHPGEKSNLKKNLEKKGIDNGHATAYSDVNDDLPKLSAEEQTVVSALKTGERLVDDVIAQTGMSTGKLLAVLTMLELKGVVKRLPGKRIALR